MKFGAHLSRRDLTKTAESWGFAAAQTFLGSPRVWRAPTPPSEGERAAVEAWGGSLWVHAPYLLNPASASPEVREKSKQALAVQLEQAAALGAQGVVVHGGQGGRESTLEACYQRWEECLEGLSLPVPVVIENTAGGFAAPGRAVESFGRLFERLQGLSVGYCLDTCHAWAGSMGLEGLLERVTGAVGFGPSLLHLNGSSDPQDCGRDRHANFVRGEEQTELSLELARSAGVPVVLETPGSGFLGDVKLLRALARELEEA